MSGLPWYPWFPSDYATDTRDLSHAEHGVYRLLLDASWSVGPLPDDLDRLCRMAAGAPAEMVRQILERFWRRSGSPPAWRNERLEKVREHQQVAHEKRVAAGRLGGSSPKKQCLSNALAKPKHPDPDPDLEEEVSYEPSPPRKKYLHLTSFGTEVDAEKASVDPAPGPVPYERIRGLWNEVLCPPLPRCEKLTRTRRGYIRQRWQENLPGLEEWRHFFEYVRESPFLMGKVPSSRGRPPFRATLDWVTRPNNYAKIYEGLYHHDHNA